MPTEATCQNCHQPLVRFGKFWMCPEHGQVSSLGGDGDVAQSSLHPSSVSLHPLEIFLSYGHDLNEELARQSKADLEERGHDVRFYKNEIKAGDDWRREITDSITPDPATAPAWRANFTHALLLVGKIQASHRR